MPKISDPAQKVRAKRHWKQGLPISTIAKKLGLPRSTVRGWAAAWENPPPPPKKRGPKPKPKGEPKGGELAKAQPKAIASPPPPPPPRPPLNLHQPRPDGELPSFVLAENELRRIINNKKTAPGVKVQAANALLKVVVLRAELPPHALTEEAQHSLGDSVEAMEGRGDEQIAQDYRELLS
jgi:hypothetical protein